LKSAGLERPVSAYAAGHGHAHVKSPISLVWVLGLSILCGIGIGMLAYWQLTGNWFYFLGIAPLLAGAIMMLSPRAGMDHA
jgi:hypothetical protein